MKKLIFALMVICFVNRMNARQDYGGSPGHVPFSHDHSHGGVTGGVCYGYAMGTLGNAACSAATIVPPDQGNNNRVGRVGISMALIFSAMVMPP